MPPLPPLAAGTVNSVMAAPAVKVLAETEPMPKDGAASVPRMGADSRRNREPFAFRRVPPHSHNLLIRKKK